MYKIINLINSKNEFFKQLIIRAFLKILSVDQVLKRHIFSKHKCIVSNFSSLTLQPLQTAVNNPAQQTEKKRVTYLRQFLFKNKYLKQSLFHLFKDYICCKSIVYNFNTQIWYK